MEIKKENNERALKIVNKTKLVKYDAFVLIVSCYRVFHKGAIDTIRTMQE
jgi:hypothetical protein